MKDSIVDKLIVRRAQSEDIAAAAKMHELAFPRQSYSQEWLACVFRAFPKSQLFIAELTGTVSGMIFWTEKSGFRQKAVVELEQIAVHPEKQGQRHWCLSYIHSVILVAEKIAERGAKLCHILENTRVNNSALRLYKKLGAQSICSISGLFTADEIFMAVNNLDLDELIKKQDSRKQQKTQIVRHRLWCYAA